MNSTALDDNGPWWRLLSRYQWYVFALAAMGWLFDTMDGQIFIASRSITMKELLPNVSQEVQTNYGGYVTATFMLGWASGGLVFGIVGDKWGRAKTMALTILIYAIFTGASGLAANWWQFGLCRFLTGVGVGGEFAAGAALVAEVMPEKARAKALGMLQALSAVGNLLGVFLFRYIEPMANWGWRGLYFVGAFPALLAVVVRMGLKEPDKWVAAKAAAARATEAGQKVGFGRLSELFTIPQWRRNTIVGLCLAIAGIVGVWGVGFWSPELIDSTYLTVSEEGALKVKAIVAEANPEKQLTLIQGLGGVQKEYLALYQRTLPLGTVVSDTVALGRPLETAQKEKIDELLERTLPKKEKTELKSMALILQQIGAFFGMYFFSVMAAKWGRRLTFFIAFVLGWGSVAITFLLFHEKSQIYYLWPLLGFGTLAPFGGYALYFPELYPTRLRTTGTGFCYNVGRYVAMLGPITLGQLSVALKGNFGNNSFRWAAVIVASSYFIGIVALLWAPETVNQPLPDDERVVVH